MADYPTDFFFCDIPIMVDHIGVSDSYGFDRHVKIVEKTHDNRHVPVDAQMRILRLLKISEVFPQNVLEFIQEPFLFSLSKILGLTPSGRQIRSDQSSICLRPCGKMPNVLKITFCRTFALTSLAQPRTVRILQSSSNAF